MFEVIFQNTSDTISFILYACSLIQKSRNGVNSLPDNKIVDFSKLKGFADDKVNVAQKSKSVLGRVKNIAGKGENAGYKYFLHYFFKRYLSLGH